MIGGVMMMMYKQINGIRKIIQALSHNWLHLHINSIY